MQRDADPQAWKKVPVGNAYPEGKLYPPDPDPGPAKWGQ